MLFTIDRQHLDLEWHNYDYGRRAPRDEYRILSELRQRQPRLLDPGFLEFLRTKPCCACGRRPRSQAAHIRMAALEYGKEHTGKQEKPNDFWATPLCGPPNVMFGCHQLQEKLGEDKFWKRVGEHPCEIAIRLYREYGGSGGKPYRRARGHKQSGYWEEGGRQSRQKRKIPSRGFPKGKRRFGQ